MSLFRSLPHHNGDWPVHFRAYIVLHYEKPNKDANEELFQNVHQLTYTLSEYGFHDVRITSLSLK